MKPIKFRAWHKTQKVWVYLLVHHYSLNLVIENEYPIFNGDLDPWQQYTGVKDKNGTDMYECDWLACANGSMGVIEYQEKHMAFKIATDKYDKEGGWSHPIEGFDPATLEVIGNLYERTKFI